MSATRPLPKTAVQDHQAQQSKEARAAEMAGLIGQGLLVACFLLLNSTLNLANKWALTTFPYPILLTSCHMASTVLLLASALLLSASREKYLAVFAREWKGICAIGAFLAFNISLNNTSMLNMTLSLNQVIRSSMPIFTCIIAFPVEGKLPKPSEIVALVVLSMGIMTCVWRSDAAGSVHAMSLCLLATLSNAAMSCFAGRVMSEAVDALQLIFLTAPFSLLFLLPYLLYKEMPRLVTEVRLHAADTSSQFTTGLTAILVGTSIVAILYNYIHARLIHATSATTTTVIGQVKIVGLVLLSAALLGESSIFDLKMIVGSLLACMGFAGYSFLRLIAKQNQHQADREETVLDVEKGGDIKQKLLDSENENELIASSSLPRKR